MYSFYSRQYSCLKVSPKVSVRTIWNIKDGIQLRFICFVCLYQIKDVFIQNEKLVLNTIYLQTTELHNKDNDLGSKRPSVFPGSSHI